MSEPMSERERWQLELDKLQRGLQGDPFAFLGPHRDPGGEGGEQVRAYLPGALAVELLSPQDEILAAMDAVDASGLFVARLPAKAPRYRLRIHWPEREQVSEDPYAFGPLLGELDLYLFAEGNHRQLASCLGAQPMQIEGVQGVRFAVWAPNARARLGGRRFQRLGRPPPPDAPALSRRRLGTVRPAPRRAWRGLQVRAAGPRRPPAAEGRPRGAGHRDAARHRLARAGPDAFPLAGPVLDAATRRAPGLCGTAVDLRSPRRLLAPPGGEPRADLG